MVIENTGIVFNLKEKAAGTEFSNSGTIIASEVPEVSGSGSYEIGSLEKLEMFRDAVNGGTSFAGVTVNLTADIALSGPWKPIGLGARKASESTEPYTGTAFKGIFNGQNHTISGLTNADYDDFIVYFAQKHNADTFCYGFFGLVDGATIKNLNLTGVDINTKLVTYDDKGTTKKAQGDSIGAIVGYSAGSLTMDNCTVSGSVIGFDAVGGLIGRAYDQNNDGTVKTVSITNCTNNADVQGDIKVAGIIGFLGCTLKIEGTQTVTITGCTNTGEIVASGEETSYTFGIAGFGFADPKIPERKVDLTIANNRNNGNIRNEATSRKFIAYIAGNCSNIPDASDVYRFSGNTNAYELGKINGKDVVYIELNQHPINGGDPYDEADVSSNPANAA